MRISAEESLFANLEVKRVILKNKSTLGIWTVRRGVTLSLISVENMRKRQTSNRYLVWSSVDDVYGALQPAGARRDARGHHRPRSHVRNAPGRGGRCAVQRTRLRLHGVLQGVEMSQDSTSCCGKLMSGLPICGHYWRKRHVQFCLIFLFCTDYFCRNWLVIHCNKEDKY